MCCAPSNHCFPLYSALSVCLSSQLTLLQDEEFLDWHCQQNPFRLRKRPNFTTPELLISLWLHKTAFTGWDKKWLPHKHRRACVCKHTHIYTHTHTHHHVGQEQWRAQAKRKGCGSAARPVGRPEGGLAPTCCCTRCVRHRRATRGARRLAQGVREQLQVRAAESVVCKRMLLHVGVHMCE